MPSTFDLSTAGPGAPKLALVTHLVPGERIRRASALPGDPEAGDLVAGQVLRLGKHTVVESRESRRAAIFPGDVVVGAYGHRYATDQFEGYAGPDAPEFDLLSIGGVCGQVVSQNELMVHPPTRLRRLGYVVDDAGRRLNLRDFALAPQPMRARRPTTVLVVGASMNSGKTTAVANTVRGLAASGFRVAAAKLTGTASSKDTWLMYDAGASGIADFTDCGHPSTYLLDLEALKRIEAVLLSHLVSLDPEFVVYEIADGLLQRETRMLLTDAEFRAGIDHVVFAGVDSLSVESGVRTLTGWGYRVAATSGLISCSVLGIREAEAAAPGIPCLGAVQLATGALLPRLGVEARVQPVTGGVGLVASGGGTAESARVHLVTGGSAALGSGL